MSETVNRFGFDCEFLPNKEGDTSEPGVLVKLGDAGGDVIVGQNAFTNCVRDSPDGDTFARCILSRKSAVGDDWAQNRGPDSDLGRNMEAGTPTTDHSSDLA